MAYTPELCLDDSAALRRIAWGLGMPMTKALSLIVRKALSLIVRKAVRKNKHYKICEHYRDTSKRNTCRFRGE